MARARNPNRDKAREIWIASNGTKKLKDIAKELGCSDSQIRKWKSQDNWESEIKSNAPNDNSNVTNETERYQSAKGNKNAKGNRGGSAPKRNQNAKTHGLFAKYLPSDTAEIMDALNDCEPIDMLWENIKIQYTAIIRSQKIMHVGDQEDLSKEESAWSSGESGSSTTLAIQYAWDKQANFLSAQSRAMGTLSNLIKQFVSLADEQDERRLKLEMMQGQIKSLNNKLAETNPEEIESDGFLEALESEGEELWPEE
ncbi:phage terminase small subunit [Enterococcus sp. 5H]|uniref:phage terminase small subunit n=1 Tax=Enterococcus sp. 5H TaxID=1229490 RepID=UPI0023042512|nr:phage terminase small subunit [Enterococcus sp. 5H]MDA9472839.1 hypothetical protein [Enterococcus sp. 5H]